MGQSFALDSQGSRVSACIQVSECSLQHGIVYHGHAFLDMEFRILAFLQLSHFDSCGSATYDA